MLTGGKAFQGRHWIDGRPDAAGRGASDVAPLAGEGHFTSLQLRAGAAQGFDLHLARLRDDHQAIFAAPLSDVLLAAALAPACEGAGTADATLRVAIRRQRPGSVPRIHVSTLPPRQVPAKAVALASALHVRRDPAHKHDGIAGQRALLAAARARGFDDALMLDAAGQVLEGTFWNLLVCREGRVLWPAGPALHGVTQRLLQHALAASGIPQHAIHLLAGALPASDALYAVNSRGVWAIGAIDDRRFRHDDHGLARLRQLLAAHPSRRLADVVAELMAGEGGGCRTEAGEGLAKR